MKDYVEMEQALMLALTALRQIDPEVDSVYCGVSGMGKYGPPGDDRPQLWAGYRDVCLDPVYGSGDSLSEKMVSLEESVRAGAERRERAHLCIHCDAEGVVTTGDGMMCAEHAMQWLRSEALEADDAVGPCGVKS